MGGARSKSGADLIFERKGTRTLMNAGTLPHAPSSSRHHQRDSSRRDARLLVDDTPPPSPIASACFTAPPHHRHATTLPFRASNRRRPRVSLPFIFCFWFLCFDWIWLVGDMADWGRRGSLGLFYIDQKIKSGSEVCLIFFGLQEEERRRRNWFWVLGYHVKVNGVYYMMLMLLAMVGFWFFVFFFI